jgi:hypothetical protein
MIVAKLATFVQRNQPKSLRWPIPGEEYDGNAAEHADVHGLHRGAGGSVGLPPHWHSASSLPTNSDDAMRPGKGTAEMTMIKAHDVALKNRPISRLNLPIQELALAARRERGRLLRAMIVSATRKVLHAFASRPKQRNVIAAKSPHRSLPGKT